MGNELSTGGDPQIPNLLWSVLRAEIARLDQGEHEMEVVCGDNMESDMRQLKERCKKHPGHKDFIPVNKLTLDHIPAPWRHPIILKDIKNKCDLTVRLVVRYTSPERPTSLGFGNLKGKSISRVGTGWFDIRGISGTPQPCPLKDCSFSSAPHDVSPFFEIETAAHVVYDDSEARKTVIEFFYDDENDRSLVMKAEGVNISFTNLDGDICYITCVTHDLDLMQNFEHIKRSPQIEIHVPNSPLAFIVSHPHGGSKQVTFGDLRHTEHLQPVSKDQIEKLNKSAAEYAVGKTYMQSATMCKFKYSIPTCSGSSGAPMYTLRFIRGGILSWCSAPHSRHKTVEQVNESGYGFSCF